MLAGNHDHGLAAGWIDARLQTEPAGFLGLEQHFAAPTRPARRSSSPTPRGPRTSSSPTPASGCATTSTRSTATTPTCTPPSRPSSASSPARWPSGSPRRPRARAPPTTTRPCSPRCTPGCTRSPSAPTTRSSARAAARRRGAYAALTRRTAARARAQDRLPRRRRRAQLARPRPAAVEPVTDRAAPRLPERHQGGDRAARHRRRARDLGPLAPLRPVADRRPAEWAGGSSTPARGSTSRTSSRPSPTARPTGREPRSSSTTTARRELLRLLGDRGHDGSGRTPGVKQVAWTVTPSPASSAARRRVWRACVDQATQPGSSTSTRAPSTRNAPAPSTTAHTPPASYGPE